MTSIKKNIMYNVLYQLLIIVLPLLTAPYISRTLGAENVGIYSYTYSVAYYFVLFAMLGINTYGNRTIAMCRDKKDELSKTFFEIYFIQLCMFIFAVAIYIVYVIFFVKEYNLIFWLQLIYVLSGLIDISWLFFGLEQFKVTVTRNTIIKLLTIALVFIFVKKEEDLWVYTLIMSLGTFLSQIYLWFHVKKNLEFSKIRKKDLKKHLKPILVLFIPVISYSIYKVMDKIMLGNMTNFAEVGFYQSSEKIINIPMGIITAVGTVMMPRMSNIISKGDKKNTKEYIRLSIKIVTLVGSALTFGIMGASKVLAPVYFGVEFKKCSTVMMLLSLTIFSLSWANVCRTQYLMPMKEDKIYVKSSIAGAVANLVINLILIPKYGANGAAVGTIFAEFFVMVIQVFAVNKKIPIIKYIYLCKHYIFCGILMFICVYFIGEILHENIISLISQLVVGFFSYVILILISTKIFNDDLLLLVKKKKK